MAEDRVILPYEEQIEPSEWEPEGAETTIMELTKLLEHTRSLTEKKSPRKATFLLVFVLLGLIAAGGWFWLSTVPRKAISSDLITSLLPWTPGAPCPSFEKLEQLRDSFLWSYESKIPSSVEQLSYDILIGIVIPKIIEIEREFAKGNPSSVYYQLDLNDPIIAFRHNLVKSCGGDPNCTEEKKATRITLLDKMVEKRGIPHSTTTPSSHNCKSSPGACKSLERVLLSLKYLLRDEASRLPLEEIHPLIYANDIVLFAECWLRIFVK